MNLFFFFASDVSLHLFYPESLPQFIVTHFLRQRRRHPITLKASPPRRNVTFACPNVWHYAHIDHLALRKLGFCAASSFNDGSVSPYPARMRLLQHAIPQGTLLHAAFFFFLPLFFCLSPSLPHISSRRLRHTVGPIRIAAGNTGSYLSFGRKSSIWRGDGRHQKKKKKSCLTI